MKHRTHPKFPKYRIYADGTIINKRTGHTLRRKYALKISKSPSNYTQINC